MKINYVRDGSPSLVEPVAVIAWLEPVENER